jgi:hypothetical protein
MANRRGGNIGRLDSAAVPMMFSPHGQISHTRRMDAGRPRSRDARDAARRADDYLMAGSSGSDLWNRAIMVRTASDRAAVMAAVT